MSKIDRRRLRACVGLPSRRWRWAMEHCRNIESKSQSESRGDAKTRRLGANGASERLSAAPRDTFWCLAGAPCVLRQAQDEGNHWWHKERPHAELVEARNALVQVSCRSRRLRRR